MDSAEAWIDSAMPIRTVTGLRISCAVVAIARRSTSISVAASPSGWSVAGAGAVAGAARSGTATRGALAPDSGTLRRQAR